MKVVHVVPASPAGRAPADVLAAHPTVPRTLAALAAAGVDAVGVARTDGPACTVVVDGVRHRFVPDRSRSAWRLARAARHERPDAVHVHGLHHVRVVLATRVLLPRTPLLVQHHGEAPAAGRRRLGQRLAARLVDGVAMTGATHGAADGWRPTLGARVPVFEVLESASDLPPGQARADVDGDPAVLWVGRLTEGKDAPAALRAFARLRAARPGARLWLVTPDAALAGDRLGPLPDGVTVVGPVPHPALADWYAACPLVLATSHHEGSGYALIEACTAGCRAVATDLPPHRAIVGPDDVLVPVGDDAAMAAALLRLAAEPDGEAGRAARARAAADRLGWAAVARGLAHAYEAITR